MGLDVRRTPGIDAKTTKDVELIIMQYPHDAVNGGSRFFVDVQVNPLANDNLRPQTNAHLSTKTRTKTLDDGKKVKVKDYSSAYSGSQIAAIEQVAGDKNTQHILNKDGQKFTRMIECPDGVEREAYGKAYAVKADIMLKDNNFVINTKTLKESDLTLPKDFQAAMFATSQVNTHILKAIDEKIQTPETSKLKLHDKNRVQPTAEDYRDAVAAFKEQYGENGERLPVKQEYDENGKKLPYFGDAKYAMEAVGRVEKYADLVEQGEKNLEASRNAFSYDFVEPAPQEQQNVADKLAKVREQMESQNVEKSVDGPELG